jgi:hypothetical protein
MRSNLQVAVGSYIGNGSSQVITSVGFEPDLVIIKGGNNHPVFRTCQMMGDLTAYLATNLADLTGAITGRTSNGFTVGSSATVNANGTTYYYLAIKGAAAQAVFRTFRYAGNAADNRDLTTAGIGFQPDFATVKQEGAARSASKIAAQSTDDSFHLVGNANAANLIQAFISSGIQLGSNTIVNGSAIYHGFALKHVAGVFQTGTFTGDGVGQTISLPFTPDWVILKNGSTTNAALMKTSALGGSSALQLDNFAPAGTATIALTTNGFTVGAHASVNGSGNTLYYMAGRFGSFNVPIIRTAI